MKVTRAKCAGACYGVQRALNMALDTASEGSRAVTLGPLIHNPQVVAQLAERGIRAVENPDQAVAGSVIYRFIIALALRANVPSECLKLISAVIVALAIAAPALKAKADFRRRRANAQKGGARHA